jgi:hypothetical protein
VVETVGLENRCTGNRTGGSNPSPSAMQVGTAENIWRSAIEIQPNNPRIPDRSRNKSDGRNRLFYPPCGYFSQRAGLNRPRFPNLRGRRRRDHKPNVSRTPTSLGLAFGSRYRSRSAFSATILPKFAGTVLGPGNAGRPSWIARGAFGKTPCCIPVLPRHPADLKPGPPKTDGVGIR